MSDNISRDIFLAFVRVHILYHADAKPFFGLEIIEGLRHHGYAMSPGTLYPVLHSLEKSGYLCSYHSVVNGKRRKYYKATAQGNLVLAEIRIKIRELVDEVLIN